VEKPEKVAGELAELPTPPALSTALPACAQAILSNLLISGGKAGAGGFERFSGHVRYGWQ